MVHLQSAQIWPVCNKGITQFYLPPTHEPYLYSPAARRRRPLAGTHCAYARREGQTELTWSHTEINVPHRELIPETVTHPSTNRTRRRLTVCLSHSRFTPKRFNISKYALHDTVQFLVP